MKLQWNINIITFISIFLLFICVKETFQSHTMSLTRKHSNTILNKDPKLKQYMRKRSIGSFPIIERYHKYKRGEEIGHVGISSNTVEYYGTLFIGNPIKKFVVQIDTGSSFLAIPSVDCEGCGNLPDPGYTEGKSGKKISCDSKACSADKCYTSDSKYCGFSSEYQDGSGIEGILVKDNITIGGISANATFGVIKYEPKEFEAPQIDGILGLAYNAKEITCLESCVKPLFDELVKQAKIKNIFTLNLNKSGGELILGGVPEGLNILGDIVSTSSIMEEVNEKEELLSSSSSSSSSSIVTTINDNNNSSNTNNSSNLSNDTVYWTPVTKEVFYQVALHKISIGGKLLDLGQEEIGDTIVDSGTTLLVFPDKVYQVFAEYMMEMTCDAVGICTHTPRNESIFDDICYSTKVFTEDNYKKYPNVSLSLSGVELTLTPKDYLLVLPNNGEDFVCSGIGTSDGVSMSILGDTVLRAFAIIFDRENSRIGFTKGNARSYHWKGDDSRLHLPTWGIAIVLVGASIVFFFIFGSAGAVWLVRRYHTHRREQHAYMSLSGVVDDMDSTTLDLNSM